MTEKNIWIMAHHQTNQYGGEVLIHKIFMMWEFGDVCIAVCIANKKL